MRSPWRAWGFTGLFARLLIVALVPSLIVGFVAIHIFSDTLNQHVQNKLMAISDSRQALLDAQLDEMSDFISEQAAAPANQEAVERLAAGFKKAGIRSEAYRVLDSGFRDRVQRHFDLHSDYLHDLLFVSREGDVIFSMRQERDLGQNIHSSALKDTSFTEMIDLVQTSLSAAYSDFGYYPPADRPAIFVAAPVFGKDRLLGTMVAQIKPKVMLEFARNYTGLPRTGEIVFAKRVGTEFVYTTLFRLSPDASLSQPFSFSDKDVLPMPEALRGEAGVGLSTDYRGVKVMARWQYIPRLCWGMVVKTDADELFAPVRSLKNVVGIVCVLMALLIAGVAFSMTWASAGSASESQKS
ncbi:MAG: hypothetical protein NTY77_05810 [Elusimicrobia bacterium]|nr:hypothetical protein [Elusimicrobiota bacterium]